jgi:hypothetical protein
VDYTWRKASISLDLLTKYFSWTDFPLDFTGDFTAGSQGWGQLRVNAFKIAFAGIFLFPTSAGRIDVGVVPLVCGEDESVVPAILCETMRSLSYYRGWGKGVPMFCVQFLQLWFCSHLRHFYLRQTPYYLTRRIVRQTVDISLPFTDTGDEWASYLLDLPLSKWSWRVTWGPAVWKLWTHCSRFGGMPLLGMWGCTDYYPGLALRQFGGLQYLPRLGDLSLVTFDYVSGGDMWKLLSLAKDIWVGRCSEMVFVEDGLSADSSVTTEFVEWREGWSPSFTPRPTIWPGVSHSSVPPSLRVSATTGQSERVTDLERELEEARAELATLRLARASEREESTAHVESMRSTLHHSNMAVANLRRDLEAQRGNVSALRAMNDFTCEQLEISEGAKDHLEEALAEAQGQLEAEQVERTRV